ncbi:MAG TPA: type II secretion system protein [Thermoanaerobaculia bacterium]|nr:type II secretion system protein [Thermoanaerobaculia bacterium]
MRRRASGITLIELVVAMAIFSVFLLILTALGSQYQRFDRQVQFRWFLHPDDMAVIARLRRDVADSRGYPVSFAGLTQTPSTLILSHGSGRTVTWELGASTAMRTEWTGQSKESTWVARATRAFEIDAWELPDGKTAVRLTGRSTDGGIVVDRIITPRPE